MPVTFRGEKQRETPPARKPARITNPEIRDRVNEAVRRKEEGENALAQEEAVRLAEQPGDKSLRVH